MSQYQIFAASESLPLIESRMSHLCAILNGVAGVVVFSAPSAVSSAWFPPAERTTATAVGILFNNLGNALREAIQ